MHNDDLLPLLKALAHETRLHIVELLVHSRLCVGALAHRLSISEAAASQHLRILRKAGLVKGEKEGYWTHYAVQTEELRRLGSRLDGLCEGKGGLRDLNLDVCSGKTRHNESGGANHV
jgi:DNA-binding transcriptional ArsR family regulator